MRISCFYFALLFLIGSTLGAWKGPRLFHQATSYALKAFTHVNTDTGVAHLFAAYGTYIIHRTYRTRLGPVNTITTSHELTSNGDGYIDVAHTKHTAAYGAEDDQIIVLVYESYRSGQNTKQCVKGNLTGCMEVYIAESLNDGVTWSKPVHVPRPTTDDVVHRTRPQVTYDREQNVVYIAYTHINQETGVSSIAFIKKPMKTGRYSTEVLLNLPRDFTGYLSPKLTVTNPKKHTGTLHLACIGLLGNDSSDTVYFNSKDQGTTWTKKATFTPNDPKGRHHVMIGAVGIAGVEDIFTIYATNNYTDIEFRYSPNNGDNWGTPVKINAIPKVLSYMKVCGQTKTLGVLFTLYSFPLQKLDLSYYNHTSKTISKLETPFKGLEQLMHLPMGECVGLIETDVKFIIGTGSRNSFFFDDDNYDYPTTSYS